MFELVFSRKANQTFDILQEQILNKWGESSLIKFEKRVYDVLLILSESPFVYKEVESYPTIRKATVHKNCSLFYKISNTRVILLFFWDNRQDPIL